MSGFRKSGHKYSNQENILYNNGNNQLLIPIMGMQFTHLRDKYFNQGNILYVNGNDPLLIPIMGLQFTH